MQTSGLNEQVKARIQQRLAERSAQPETISTTETKPRFQVPSLDLPRWALPALLLTGLVGGFSMAALNTVLSKNPDLLKHQATMKALEDQQESNAIATTEAIKEAGTDICVGICKPDASPTPEASPSPSPAPVASPSPEPSPPPSAEPYQQSAQPLVLPSPQWNPSLYQNWMVYYLAQIPANWDQWVDFKKTATPAVFSEPEQEQAFYDAFNRVKREQWSDWIEWCAKNSDGLAPASTEQDRQICNSLK